MMIIDSIELGMIYSDSGLVFSSCDRTMQPYERPSDFCNDCVSCQDRVLLYAVRHGERLELAIKNSLEGTFCDKSYMDQSLEANCYVRGVLCCLDGALEEHKRRVDILQMLTAGVLEI